MAPMLKVDAVTKRYGRHLALQALSFTAEKGEIIALLGRNGAGKSTLMNILTGYIAMTDGSAQVAGYDVQAQALQARRHVGYLPEQPPLYSDMTVTEYLRYCAELKGLPRGETKQAIAEVIDTIGLGDYRRRLAGQLSKGYRQRLGLAQAMLGKPDLLILDEPGSGLDPLQMAQMREVIRHAAEGSTVILSSHILSEVTDMCSRALVLDKGQCIYDGDMAQLLSDRNRMTVTWQGGSGVAEALNRLNGVRVERLQSITDGTQTALLWLPDEHTRSMAAQIILQCGAELLELTPEKATLESAFLHLIDRQEVQA